MANSLDFNRTRYTHRDYESLKKDLIDLIPSLTQKWTSTEESDPGIVLIKLISMLGDNLSYNMDKMALEMYIDSVTQRKNCRKVLALLGYKMHWYRSARVTATVKNMVQGTLSGEDIILTPWESSFRAGSLQYVLVNEAGENTRNVVLSPYEEGYQTINLVEGYVGSSSFSGDNLQNNRYYFVNKNIDESYIRLLVDPGDGSELIEVGELVNNLYLVTDNDRVYFEFNTDEYDNPYIELIDYWKSIAGENANFVVQYIITNGSKGNITDNAFESITYGSGSYLYISNLTNNTENSLDPYNSPGKDPQTPDDARKDSANWVFTYDTLVSASDFEKATRRSSGIYNSKLVDGEIVKLDNLNFQEILYRHNDDIEFSDYLITEESSSGAVTYRMTPYIVIMYMIHQNFTYNEYADSYDETVQNNFFNDTSNALNQYDPETESYSGQLYFPYKPGFEIRDQVTLDLSNNKIMNVELHYGTTKVFPFKVAGTLHFTEPLDPTIVISIVDLVNNALILHFRPDNRSYGQKPSFLEIVDVVQEADSRIKYFDAETSLIEWVLGNTPEFDTTSFAKYQGLSSLFNIDSRFLKFKIRNITDSDITLNAPAVEDAVTIREGYESIDMTIRAGTSVTVVCENIPQVRTLSYYINSGKLSYLEGGTY